MKLHKKLYTKTKLVNVRKWSKTPNEVKPHKNRNENPQNFLKINHIQKEDTPSHKLHTKLEWRPEIVVKLSFSWLNDSKISELHTFDNITISLNQKRSQNQKGRSWVHKTPLFEGIQGLLYKDVVGRGWERKSKNTD